MAPTPTPREVCRHCGVEWRPGWERCHRCGATLRNRIAAAAAAAEARDTSGLELDRRPRPGPREAPTGRTARVEPSEAPTRELTAEPRPRADPASLVALSQLLSGALAVLLVGQVLIPAVLPSVTALVLYALRGERVGALRWIAASVPWVLTAGVLGAALAAARGAVERPLVRSTFASALAAVLPGVLLVGWPSLHGHLGSALVRRGGRKGAALLTGWSRGALVCLSLQVGLTILDGSGLVPVPALALAVVTAAALAARQGHLCALGIALPSLLRRPARMGAPVASQLLCPECGSDAPTLQRFREGLAGSACARCAGALLGPGQVSTLLSMAHVEDATYRREIKMGATGTRPMHCPQCGSAMRGVQLRAVAARGCPACGSLWVDRVGLSRLTGGRPVLTVTPPATRGSPGRAWPALAAAAALLVAAVPWVAVRAGWCRAEFGACASVPASITMR